MYDEDEDDDQEEGWGQGRTATLQVDNISDDTSALDLYTLFRKCVRVKHVAIQFYRGVSSFRVEAFVTVGEDYAEYAKDWADGRSWRGRKLKVNILKRSV